MTPEQAEQYAALTGSERLWAALNIASWYAADAIRHVPDGVYRPNMQDDLKSIVIRLGDMRREVEAYESKDV